jgi:hypothetical protein
MDLFGSSGGKVEKLRNGKSLSVYTIPVILVNSFIRVHKNKVVIQPGYCRQKRLYLSQIFGINTQDIGQCPEY